MPEYNCQNLTEAILSLSNLNARIDSSYYNLDSADGFVAKEEAIKTLKSYDLITSFRDKNIYSLAGRLGTENLMSLIDMVGTPEELKKRITTIEVGKKTPWEFYNESRENHRTDQTKIRVSGSERMSQMLSDITQTDDYRFYRKNPMEVDIIRLKVSELVPEAKIRDKYVYEDDLLKKIKELRLENCPNETGLALALKELNLPENCFCVVHSVDSFFYYGCRDFLMIEQRKYKDGISVEVKDFYSNHGRYYYTEEIMFALPKRKQKVEETK
jgi:hypothetical protein